MELLTSTGSVDSSSHRLSLLVQCKTMPVNRSLLLMSSATDSKSETTLSSKMSQRSLMLVVSSMVSSWKVLDGTIRLT